MSVPHSSWMQPQGSLLPFPPTFPPTFSPNPEAKWVPFATRWDDVRMLVFPLSRPPFCRRCHRPCVKEYRAFRYCFSCPCAADSFDGSAWGTWDDASGIGPANPVCDCGYYSRMTRDNLTSAPRHSCAVDECGMAVFRTRQRMQDWEVTSSGSTTPVQTPLRAGQNAREVPPPQVVYGSRACVTRLTQQAERKFVADTEFTRLLDHVLEAAERTKFPRKREPKDYPTFLPPSRNPLPTLEERPPIRYHKPPFILEASSEFERHAKIAVAGEVFVFVTICNLLLASYSTLYIGDWRSNLRNLVAEHHRAFYDWPLLGENDTPGMVIPDDDGCLTKLLIDNGHLEAKIWSGQKPEYYVDVKTSLTDRCVDFHLSSGERERVEAYSDPKPCSSSRPQIYMIIRVTNLQEHDIKMKIHVNPASTLKLRQVWVASDPDLGPR